MSHRSLHLLSSLLSFLLSSSIFLLFFRLGSLALFLFSLDADGARNPQAADRPPGGLLGGRQGVPLSHRGRPSGMSETPVRILNLHSRIT